MIICHRHRFIFIKTRKTASSSLEIGLSRVCGPGDVVTTLSTKSGDESLRAREGGFGPCNWQKPILRHHGWKEWRRLLFRFERAQLFAPHMPVKCLRELIEPEVFSGYHKLTLERNPWDRAVSRFYWQKHRSERGGRKDFPGISDYLAFLEREKPHWLSNWQHYTINDELAVDRVILYENLKEGIEAFRREQGIEGNIALPETRAKGGHRKQKQHYSELLSPADRQRVARVCAREIEAFGYVF